MPFGTVVIPFSGTAKWGQILISCLKKYKNERDFDVLVVDTTCRPVWELATKAITDTPIGEGVKVVKAPADYQWHGGALDHALSLIDTPYLFGIDSDCTIERDGWLDYYASFMKDEYVAMAGWYWTAIDVERADVDDGRHLIACHHTLYNTRILDQIQAEIDANPETILSYGPAYTKRYDLDTHPFLGKFVRDKVLGPFSEIRGYYHMYPFAVDVDHMGSWADRNSYEPSHWLYNRAYSQWECAKMPGHVVLNPPGSPLRESHTFVGPSDAEAYLRHYWGGTVSHEYELWPCDTWSWKNPCFEWWINRENMLWEKHVPEDIRKLTLDLGIVKPMDKEIEYIRSRVTCLNP